MKKTIKCSSGGGGHFTRTINIFKKNYKILIGVLIGIIISVGGTYAATAISGSIVTYSNTDSGLSSTTVQDAIDELNTKATTQISVLKGKLTTYEFGEPTEDSETDFTKVISSKGSNVFVKKEGSQLSVCAYDNNRLFCMKSGEEYYEENKAMLNTTTFPNATCSIDSSGTASCSGDSCYRSASKNGDVSYMDSTHGGIHYCDVSADGTINCGG